MTRTRTPLLALLVILAVYGGWILSHWEPVCVSPDAVGICQQAQQMSEAGLEPFRPRSPAQLVGAHWIEVAPDTYRGRFPPGYPALLAAAYRLAGPDGSLLLGPLLGVAAIGLLFFIGRIVGSQKGDGASPPLLAALLLASFPLQNRLVLHGDTHVPALVCLFAGIWLLLRWERNPSKRRAFAAGLAWGLLPSLRYGEAVMSLAAGVFLAVRAWPMRTTRRGTLACAAAGAGLPLSLLAVHNTLAYGRPWRTGYAFTGEQSAFGLSEIPDHVSFYVSSLLAHPVLALYLAFGLVALGAMIRDRQGRPFGLFLLGAIALSGILYTSYYWGEREHPALALRFFLPASGCLLVAVAWLLGRGEGWKTKLLRLVASGLILLGIARSQAELRDEGLALEGGFALVAAARQVVPGGSVLVSPWGLGETLSYENQWHMVPQWIFPGDPLRQRIVLPWEIRADMLPKEGDGPSPMQADRGAGLRSHYRGLEPPELVQAVLADIRRWQPSADLYWMGDPVMVASVDSLLPGGSFRALGHVTIPAGREERVFAGGSSRPPPRIPLFVWVNDPPETLPAP